MTNQQAHETVLTWCRSESAQAYGCRPVMRQNAYSESIVCRVFDASTTGFAMMAEGLDWIEVCGMLGCYGPQKEAPKPYVAPVKPRYRARPYRREARR